MGMASLILALVAGSAPCATAARPTGTSPGVEAPSYEKEYRQGIPFAEFLANAQQRRAMWHRHYQEGALDDAESARALAVTGTWRLLAVAVAGCSDSVNTIPYLAILADTAPSIELRVIDSELGAEIMKEHRTPDGRSATPTVIVLNERYEEAGCWVERPSALQAWAMENREALGDQFLPEKMAWYREDAGHSTIDEVLAVIEAAVAGGSLCTTG